MKIVVIILVILSSFSTAKAQKDLIDRLEKQAVEIDSLKKVVKSEMEGRQKSLLENTGLKDTLKLLKSDLSKLEDFRIIKKKTDTVLRQKSDSIVLLKAAFSEKEKQVSEEIKKGEKREADKYEAGKSEIISTIGNSYKGKSFDELLGLLTRQSAQRDLQLFQNQTEIKQMLSDIEKYYSAKELLDARFDIVQLKNIEIQLAQIKQKSTLLDKLREVISSYKIFNDGLKETLERIRSLDNAESVSKMSKDVQKKKFDKVLAELSSYIFNYDFNVTDYPYLTNIFFTILKRKQPNPDEDITDLINKL